MREAFLTKDPFNPQLSVSLAVSASHAAFNADESYLVLAVAFGGLAIYAVDDLLLGSGQPNPTFEVSTGGVTLREVKPNPVNRELVAVLDANGNARMLDLVSRKLSEPLKDGVVTVTWSQRGVQIVCGLGDGTGWQMNPQGQRKAVLPAVPSLENHFLSSIMWLENNVFITAHTPAPSNAPSVSSVFHVLSRSGSSYQYTKLPEPCPPWGLKSRAPPYYFGTHLKGFAPHLRDLLLFASTCGTDIGVVSRFPADSGDVKANTFTVTPSLEDNRRAAMPLTGDATDTSPIGIAIDLTSKDNVRRPIGGDELDESPGPLPILMVLNHEGKLSAWHIVCYDAIIKGDGYSGMTIGQPLSSNANVPPLAGSSNIGDSLASAVLVGGANTSMGSPFGQTSILGNTAPAFGKPTFGLSTLGKPAFGQSSFGSPSTSEKTTFSLSATSSSLWSSSVSVNAISASDRVPKKSSQGGGSTFGQTSTLGTHPTPTFGQSTQLGAKPAGPFASAVGSTNGGSVLVSAGSSPAGTGFGAYASKGGFASLASNSSEAGSIFGSGSTLSVKNNESAFSSKLSNTGTGLFGSSSPSGFKLSSAFRPDSSKAKDNNPSASLNQFSLSLGDTFSTSSDISQTKETDMEEETDQEGSDIEQEVFSPTVAVNKDIQNTPKSLGSSLSSSLSEQPTSPPFSTSPFVKKPVSSTVGVPASSIPSLFARQNNRETSPFGRTAAVTMPNPFAKPNPFSQGDGHLFNQPKALSAVGQKGKTSTTASSDIPATRFSTAPPSLSLNLSSTEVRNSPKSGAKDVDSPTATAPLPPNDISKATYAPGSTTSGEVSMDGSPESSMGGDGAPFPPDFTIPKKEPEPGHPPTLPNIECDEDFENEEADDERDDTSKHNGKETQTLKSLIRSDKKQKPPASSSGGASSIFGSHTSYQGTFGEKGFQNTSPFSNLAKKPKSVSDDDEGEDEDDNDDDDDKNEYENQVGVLQRKVSPPKKVSAGRSLFGRTNDSSSKIGMRLPAKAVASLAGRAKETNVSNSSTFTFDQRLSVANAKNGNLPGTGGIRPNVQPDTPEAKELESEVERDGEYSDDKDEKIREQLLRFPPKIVEILPEIKKTKEVDVADVRYAPLWVLVCADVNQDFDDVFDSIYLSGNIMVNKLGQTARSLAGFYLGQQNPIDRVSHIGAEDMRLTKDWRFCEIDISKKAAEELFEEVRLLKKRKKELEDKRKLVSKGFIKRSIFRHP